MPETNVETQEPTFVPNYIKEPDLAKAWSLPGDSPSALPPASTFQNRTDLTSNGSNDNLGNTSQNRIITQSTPSASTMAPNTIASKRELLVYNDARDDSALFGSIWVDPADSIELSVSQIKNELDDIPESFKISRHNGRLAVRVNTKQYSQKTLEFFQPPDALIIHKT